MARRHSIWWFLRVAALLALMAWTYVLYRWSQRADPRFYRFAESKPGRVLADVFAWRQSPLDRPVPARAAAEMTPEERQIQRELETLIQSDWPTHTLVFDNYQRMTGRIVSEDSNTVEFIESYGPSGDVVIRADRRRILSLEPVTNRPPPVSYRDVRFRMDLPAFHFYKRPPYTIMTDESFFRVEHTVDILQDLYLQWDEVFRPLAAVREQPLDIQVLFFSREQDYMDYLRRYAPHMTGSSGFYSPQLDRLIVYNLATSEKISRLRETVEAEVRRFRALHGDAVDEQKLRQWRDEVERKITQLADSQTLSAIRHEGAHQLFYTMGVHSRLRTEGEWLIEGLAGYCETPGMGERDEPRLRLLKQAYDDGSLIPLGELVNLRSQDGLMHFRAPRRVELAYAQAWALVQFFMQPDYRARFFDYIRFLRDPAQFDAVVEATPLAVLCRRMGLRPEELWEEWLVYVGRITRHLKVEG